MEKKKEGYLEILAKWEGASWVEEGDALGSREQAQEWAKVIFERTGKKMEDMNSEEVFVLIDQWREEEPNNPVFGLL